MSSIALVDGVHLVRPIPELSCGLGDSKSDASGVSEQNKTAVDDQTLYDQPVFCSEDPKSIQGSMLENGQYRQSPWDTRRESVH